MSGTMPGARRRGRPRTVWMDNIKMWTGLLVEESIRMTWDREIYGESTSMVWPTLGWRTAKVQNMTAIYTKTYASEVSRPKDTALNNLPDVGPTQTCR